MSNWLRVMDVNRYEMFSDALIQSSSTQDIWPCDKRGKGYKWIISVTIIILKQPHRQMSTLTDLI